MVRQTYHKRIMRSRKHFKKSSIGKSYEAGCGNKKYEAGTGKKKNIYHLDSGSVSQYEGERIVDDVEIDEKIKQGQKTVVVYSPKLRANIRVLVEDLVKRESGIKKVNFTWKLPDGSWSWEAIHYEGHGIFYGKVISPFVPNGEFGTWYLWDVEQNGGVLVQGNKFDLDKIRKSLANDRELQQAVM